MTERFTLLAELGRGGMGVVWKARDEETGRTVALKLLHAAFAVDPDYVTRFERELELAKRIHSAHVVEVLGYGARDGAPYLALEYVDGPTLRELLASHGAYSWQEANALLAQITQGLADAHAAGVIHRDLKPSNVLIGADGVAKLADFGIAKGLDLTGLTGTSTLLGTLAYLAPEGPLDERSDLYSLGIVAFELLSGAAPFTGKTYQEVIVRHIRETPDLAKLPLESRNIVGWLLAKDPAARPQRASALLKVLYGAAVRAVPAVPQPPPAPATVMPQPLVAPSQPFGPSGPSVARPMMPIGQPISYGTAAPVAPVAPIHAQLAGSRLAATDRGAARTTVAWSARLAAAGRYLGLGPGLVFFGAIAAAISCVLPWATVSWPSTSSESVPLSGFDIMHSPLFLVAAAMVAITALIMVGSDENLGMRSGSARVCVVLGLAVLAGSWLAWQSFSSSLSGGEAHVQLGPIVACLGGGAILVGPMIWAHPTQRQSRSSRSRGQR